MKSHWTQKAKILYHMRCRGSISSMVAFRLYQITRLAARIVELEHEGHLINHTPITRNGRTYTSYSLVEGQRKAA